MIKPSILLFTLAAASLATGCIMVGPNGEYYLRTAKEEAIIVWDQASQTEHFIRRASFESNASNVGFIVPTPSVPRLRVTKPSIFAEFNRNETKGGTRGTMGSVTVIKEVKLGDYDATVLKATDPGALNSWLKRNGFSRDRRFNEWALEYIRKGWVFTAFKIVRQPAAGFELAPIQMSFKTTTPFYPYREPTNSSAKGRSLALHVVSKSKLSARFGKGAWKTASEGPFQIKRQAALELGLGLNSGALGGCMSWSTSPTRSNSHG